MVAVEAELGEAASVAWQGVWRGVWLPQPAHRHRGAQHGDPVRRGQLPRHALLPRHQHHHVAVVTLYRHLVNITWITNVL